MSTRDEMMKTLVDFTSFPGGVADEVLQTLTSAGFRILGPDEVDPVTLDKCAEVAYRHVREPSLSDNPSYVRFEPADFMAKKIASAIRALAGAKP